MIWFTHNKYLPGRLLSIDRGLSFLMFFIELVLFSSQYLILRGGVCYTLPRYDIFGRKGIFELEHIKESREDEGNHRCMP